MPCNTVTTVSIKLKADIVRMDLLSESVKRCGHRITGSTENELTWNTGSYSKITETITERSGNEANRIRQTYAAQLTQATLGRAGWRVRTVEQKG